MKKLISKIITERSFFYLLVFIGILPLIFAKYYLTLDGAGHLYNGNIIRELLAGNNPALSDLFKLNSLPVPNWISHFLFAFFNLFIPDSLSEKIVLGIYLILFPVFFRKIILWFVPENKAFSYLGVLFAHNHLLYLGSYNLVFALVAFFGVTYYILKFLKHFNLKQISVLALLFLLVYFSHMLILLVTIVVAFILPFASLKVEKTQTGFNVSNWTIFKTKLIAIAIAILPTLALTIVYILNVDSLEEAGRMNLQQLLKWLADIRPLLTLCYCDKWTYFTHALLCLFVLMVATNTFLWIKKNTNFTSETLHINLSRPRFSIFWFLLFVAFTILYLIVPNANILPERLIILVFLFLCFWLSTQKYPKWLHKVAVFIIVTTHICFVFFHSKAMREISKQIVLMKEVTNHIEEGSLLLPFNYAYDNNWLHMHSSGYFGSGKPIVVIENYEGQLKWFPVNWKIDGKYELSPINVWAADNKKMVKSFYQNPQNPDVFSLPLKDGKIQEIPYVVIFGAQPDETNSDFALIKSILEKSYTLTFQNGFCYLYKLGK